MKSAGETSRTASANAPKPSTPNDPAVGQRDQRLYLQHEFAAFQTPAHSGFKFERELASRVIASE